MIISRTPFRMSFFGGGTDYPAWYLENQGAVLVTTIDKYCYVSCRYLPPFFDHHSRIGYSRIENVLSNWEIEHPSVRETLRFMKIQEGVEIHHDGDLPARSGLGSSSAFTVCLLHALYALKQVMPTKIRLAQEAIHIERDLIQEAVGSQDQVAAAFGGFNRFAFEPNGAIVRQPVILSKERLAALQQHMMLFFSGFSRYASEIAKSQIESTRENRNRSQLLTMCQMVDEAIDILSGNQDLQEFGKLLHESWLLKRSLTNKITTPEVDAIYETARRAGAIGGKLLGAGGGGFVLIFAKPEDQPAIREALKHLLYVPFRFENSGSQIIFYDHGTREGDHSPVLKIEATQTEDPQLIPAN